MFEEDEDYQDSWLCETKKEKTEEEDLDSETEDELESETEDESESAFEAEINIVLSETEKLDFNRLSFSKNLSEKDIFMLNKLRRKTN